LRGHSTKYFRAVEAELFSQKTNWLQKINFLYFHLQAVLDKKVIKSNIVLLLPKEMQVEHTLHLLLLITFY